MNSQLIKQNNLICGKHGIWVADRGRELSYSDGYETERYLKDALTQVENRAIVSQELEKYIIDWPSEYHLSSQRANLFKALSFDGINEILELGCGCGALTRFLGELGGQVDAVEGSFKRAEIARLRCKAMDNVNIIQADFNALDLPSKSYDAVSLIGVLEYAKRFNQKAPDALSATIQVLETAFAALRENGLLLIAIENRMGLKYWMGAAEDHFAKANIGLYGYPTTTGMRTFDRKEWRSLLQKSGIEHYRFLYPFPDYKIPTTILADTFLRKDPNAHSLLYRVFARDYSTHWTPEADEFLLWEGLQRSSYLEEFANSFLILAGKNKERIDAAIPYDFVHFSSLRRKPIYRNLTFKKSGDTRITKTRLFPELKPESSTDLINNVQSSEYVNGQLLAAKWIRAIVGDTSGEEFKTLLTKYYRYLIAKNKNGDAPGLALDRLPFNIIINSSDEYCQIDEEWLTATEVSVDFVLFRALLWFGFAHQSALQPFFETHNIHNLSEFIWFGYNLLEIKLEKTEDEFIRTEEWFQKKTSFQLKKAPVRKLLFQPIQPLSGKLQKEYFNTKLYWVFENESMSNKCSLALGAHRGPERQILFFSLPAGVTRLQYLRFDPCDCPGFFHIYNITLKWYDLETASERIVWELNGGQKIASACVLMKGVQYCKSEMGEVFLAFNEEPQLLFEFKKQIAPENEKGCFQLQVEMDWPKSTDYIILQEEMAKKCAENEKLSALLDHKEALIVDKNARISELEGVFNTIRQSRIWPLIRILRNQLIQPEKTQ